MTFGKQLEVYRLRAGLSGAQLARTVGIDASYASRVERGERQPPSDSVIEAICRALDLSAADALALYRAAGRVPAYDPTVAAVLRVLAAADVGEEQRAAFRRHVEQAAAWVQGRVRDATVCG